MPDAPPLGGPLVDAQWVRAHRDAVHVVDVRWYLDGRSGLDAYFSGHIRGAVWADTDNDLSGPPGPIVGRHPLPTPERFAAAMSSLGIGNDDTVVAYDDASGSIAARLWWMLDAIGVRAAVLDGGLASWTGDLSREPVTPEMARFTPRPWPKRRFVEVDEVDDVLQHGVLLDARSFERYSGIEPGIDARAGHIPGARNAPWSGNLDSVSGRFLPAEALRRRYEALGVADGTRVVASCGSGVTACHDLLALRLAGFADTALYAGSWSGWSSDPDRTGRRRRGVMSSPSAADRATLRRRLGRVGVWLAALGLRVADEERAAAATIEELGYPALWFGETPANKEAFAHAAILLARPGGSSIATGIASIYVARRDRHATGGNALAEAYPGRFVLGIGVSHAPMVELRGHDYGKPVAAMREYLDAMDEPEVQPAAARRAAAGACSRRCGPRMLELARDRSHGAHPYLVTPRHTALARDGARRRPGARAGAGLRARDRPGAGPRDRPRAPERPYLKLPNYVNSWREEGFEDADFADGGSDRLVDALVAWGDADAIAERVREHLDAGADHVCLQPVARDLAGALSDLAALAPRVLALLSRSRPVVPRALAERRYRSPRCASKGTWPW